MRGIITSAQNPKVKLAIKLRRTAIRKKEDLIIIEGFPEINAAAQAGLAIETLFYCREFAAVERKPEGIMNREILAVSAGAFRKITYRQNPDGFIALAKPKYRKLDEITLGALPLLVVLEAVEKPGNLGAVLRSAEAAGADAVMLCGTRTDIYNPNVIRASLGAVFILQPAVCTTPEAITWLMDKNIKTFAATPQARLNYTEADFTGPSAVIVGTEHEGLSPVWLKAAQEKISIPMRGRIDSLNASVSAAVIMFEAMRQRSERL